MAASSLQLLRLKTLKSWLTSLFLSKPHIKSSRKSCWLCLQNISRIWPVLITDNKHSPSQDLCNVLLIILLSPPCLLFHSLLVKAPTIPMGYQAPLSSSFLPSNDSRHMSPSWFLRHVRYAFHPRCVSAFSFLSQNFSLRDYNNHVISLQVKQPNCSCDIALHRSTLLHKQSHCTGTRTKSFSGKDFLGNSQSSESSWEKLQAKATWHWF